MIWQRRERYSEEAAQVWTKDKWKGLLGKEISSYVKWLASN